MVDPSTDCLEVWFVDQGSAAGETASRLTEQAEGLAVTAVASPDRVLERLSDSVPDCLVTAHHTGFDGLALVARIDDRWPDLPTVVFADPSEGLTDRALAAGATDVVRATGPDRFSLLAHRIHSAVRSARTGETDEGAQAGFEGEIGRLFTAVVGDVSGRQERDERFNRLASAIESAVDGIAILDADGVYQFVNDAHAEMYGYDDPEAMVGERWRGCHDAGETDRFETEIVPALRETGTWRGEAIGRGADGEQFPQEVSLAELGDGSIVCVVRDVTERAERRRLLREEREFTESVLDSLHDVFYVLGEDGTLRRWNDRLREVTGYTDEELDGMDALELLRREDRESVAEAVASVLRGETETETVRSALVTKQGERIPYEFNGTQLTDADGNVVGLAGTGRDVTGEQLREQRLSVLSRVLRHNVRNRMTVVQANAEYLGRTVDDPVVREQVDRIVTAAEELVEMSNRARQAERVLREGQSVREEVDLVNAVEVGIAEVADGADVRVESPATAPALAVGDVDVAVTELIENAIEHTDDPTVRVTVTHDGDEAAVTVADGGSGIPEHERRVLTADSVTQLEHGTGIGLWLVNWIVTVSGGEVRFRSSERGGSEVVLSFPAA